ncbi:hypothetical protein [Sporosarcina sp. BP05]|uniref:hypothetical protein n=1 Tax=Sporosarcina sp. BP05 TaxID=2758726 RepID=UPI001646F481|nr:hypothetical protein [Sporosarcina sp. BP05]
MFFNSKICRKKLYIFPEVEDHIAKQSSTELIELGFLVLETSLLLLRRMNNSNDKKKMQFWRKRISHNVHALPELLWGDDEQTSQLIIRKQSEEDLEYLRFKISKVIQTLFSFEENERALFKMEQIHMYFEKWDWIKR